ncbi:hypothetical protein U1Q18_018658 [Sarracenia purpurea var. burkii]
MGFLLWACVFCWFWYCSSTLACMPCKLWVVLCSIFCLRFSAVHRFWSVASLRNVVGWVYLGLAIMGAVSPPTAMFSPVHVHMVCGLLPFD